MTFESLVRDMYVIFINPLFDIKNMTSFADNNWGFVGVGLGQSYNLSLIYIKDV